MTRNGSEGDEVAQILAQRDRARERLERAIRAHFLGASLDPDATKREYDEALAFFLPLDEQVAALIRAEDDASPSVK